MTTAERTKMEKEIAALLEAKKIKDEVKDKDIPVVDKAARYNAMQEEMAAKFGKKASAGAMSIEDSYVNEQEIGNSR